MLTCISPAHLPLTFSFLLLTCSLLLHAYVLPHCMLFIARRCQARCSDQPLWRSSVATLVPLALLRLGSQHSAARALRHFLRWQSPALFILATQSFIHPRSVLRSTFPALAHLWCLVAPALGARPSRRLAWARDPCVVAHLLELACVPACMP